MFRAERSGVLSGLQRVRQINLDDTHVFCRPDQVADEITRALRSAIRAQRILELPIDYVRLSLRDDTGAWLGTDAQWDASQQESRDAANHVLSGYELPLVEAAGEAAFYGPKLDLQVGDGRGHEETIAIVQLDFSQPEQFDLTYQAADGTRQRVVMIHRGTVGAMERVVASLLDRHQGRLPLWLAPVQVIVLPVSQAQDPPARAAVDLLRAHGLRVDLALEGTLGSRIRDAHHRRIPLIAVIGEREASDDKVHVTDGTDGSRHTLLVEDVADMASTAHQRRSPIRW